MWVAAGLLAGGAIGNLADRVRAGEVTDYVDLLSWPPFNLADVAITAGVLVLGLHLPARRGAGARGWLSRSCGSSISTRPWPSSTSRRGWSSTRRPSHQGTTLVDELGDILGGGEDPERPGIVHRLDKGTSGLLVVARGDEAHAALQAAVQAP